MTKQEILKDIENGESVWFVDFDNKVKEVILEKTAYIKENYVYLTTNGKYQSRLKYIVDRVCKTKAEAEHYLHHANITRTEHLPFLIWEEFEQRKSLYFTDKQGKEYKLTRDVRWNNNESGTEYCLKINNLTDFKIVKSYGYSEANFYKAYDECVRLFRGEE